MELKITNTQHCFSTTQFTYYILGMFKKWEINQVLDKFHFVSSSLRQGKLALTHKGKEKYAYWMDIPTLDSL